MNNKSTKKSEKIYNRVDQESEKRETKKEDNDAMEDQKEFGGVPVGESEMLTFKNRNKKKIEKEGTKFDLLGEGDIIIRESNKKEDKERNYEKNSRNNSKKSENLEIIEENLDINSYKDLPKIKNGKEVTAQKLYSDSVREEEDNCDKCPLRCLVFIPIYIGYCCLSFFDFLTYLIVPIVFCLFYTIIFLCNSCKNIISNYQVEEEIGFSGAFTSENEIKLHVADEGGVLHLNEILCFSYMSACVKRYFCFIFVLINHIIVPILQAWKRAKDCFITSKIEILYDERIAIVEEAKKYRGYDQAETQIEINNI